uniref:Odorant receptor n=1 Tax=Dendrolimus punctatus TaxID=238572 RepID=A0A2K8GL58_9NEOP|nr:Odorant Receptor 65 [Dendrolimus punctatus]
MPFFIKNINWSLCLSLNILKFAGFLIPETVNGFTRIVALAYWFFWFMFVVGTYIIVQVGELIQVWGDVSLMVGTSFVLFSNMASGIKVINLLLRKKAIQALIDQAESDLRREDRRQGIQIIKRCDKETTWFIYGYLWLPGVTLLGLIFSSGKRELLISAWYPYDTSKSPGFEISYFHQVAGLLTGALFNISLDTLVTTLMALCRCRLRLLALSLRTMGEDLQLDQENIFTEEQEQKMKIRLRDCIQRHHETLDSAVKIQKLFSIPIFTQFSVSSVIMCITAYQLAIEVKQHQVVRVISMLAYLLCMITQVFLYCYQGHQLADESSNIAYAAYECPWYACSIKFRRSLLLVMVRTRRVSQITVGGLTPLSLTCFAAMIKASYTFFTVLQQMEDRH